MTHLGSLAPRRGTPVKETQRKLTNMPLSNWSMKHTSPIPLACSTLRVTLLPRALTEKVVLVTSMLLWEMPPLRLPGMFAPCCFFWLLTIVSMEWLRTRMALWGGEGRGSQAGTQYLHVTVTSWQGLQTQLSVCPWAHGHALLALETHSINTISEHEWFFTDRDIPMVPLVGIQGSISQSGAGSIHKMCKFWCNGKGGVAILPVVLF